MATKKTEKITKLELDDISDLIGCHPRTVLRAIEGDTNAYWAEGHNPVIRIDKVLLAFNASFEDLNRVYKMRDEFLRPKEASQYLDIPHRTFVYRKYEAALRCGGIVRYSRLNITNENIDKYIKL